jgi:hypothetical protein
MVIALKLAIGSGVVKRYPKLTLSPTAASVPQGTGGLWHDTFPHVSGTPVQISTFDNVVQVGGVVGVQAKGGE